MLQKKTIAMNQKDRLVLFSLHHHPDLTTVNMRRELLLAVVPPVYMRGGVKQHTRRRCKTS